MSDSPCIETVQSIKQGETLTVSGRLFNDENAVVDWTGYKVAFMVYSSPGKELLFSSEEGREDVMPVALNADGTLSFSIDGSKTRTMSGNYCIEGKITKDDKVMVSDKVAAFTVIESRIGATDRI